MEAVDTCAKLSMARAVAEVKALPDYTTDGEVCILVCAESLLVSPYDNSSQQWVITDARHDSTANAFHTTVPCLSGRYND